MNFYCISVRIGMEEKYKQSVEPVISDDGISGTLHFFRKKMRLKTGKEYCEPFFPGYLFFETEETLPVRLKELEAGKGFIRFLPSNQEIAPLANTDLSIVTSILRFGDTVGIQNVTFDKGDRIVIVDGPFKDFSGKVVAVNRRNKRVNIELDFMGSVRVVGLSYEVVRHNPHENKKTDC